MSIEDLFQADLIPIVLNAKLTPHALTKAAWQALVAYHRPRTTLDAYRRFCSELAALLPVAALAWDNQALLGVLCTEYDFTITSDRHADVLWYLGNTEGGITVMRSNEAVLHTSR